MEAALSRLNIEWSSRLKKTLKLSDTAHNIGVDTMNITMANIAAFIAKSSHGLLIITADETCSVTKKATKAPINIGHNVLTQSSQYFNGLTLKPRVNRK